MIFMNSKYRLLSYPISIATPIYGSNPELKIMPHHSISNGDSSNSAIISVHNHTGTHVDAPKHFIDEGRPISDYSQDELIFKRPLIADCPKGEAALIMPVDLQHISHLFQTIDCLLLHTGFTKFRGEEKYRTHNPGIAPETILWIRKEYPNIRCIGIDSISISSFQHRNSGREAHKLAFVMKKDFGEPLLIIEDMKLELIKNLTEVIVIPWQVQDLDSAPCSVLALVI